MRHLRRFIRFYNKRMAKANALEKERRIRIIQEWIIDDAPTADIITKIMDTWKVQRSQASKDLKTARERWCEKEDEVIDNKRMIRVHALKKLKRSIKDQYKGTPNGVMAVLAVEKEINKLEGVYPVSHVEVTGKNGEPLIPPATLDMSKLSKEQLKAIIEAEKTAKGEQ